METIQTVHAKRHHVRNRRCAKRNERSAGGPQIRRAVAHSLRQGEEAGHHDESAIQAGQLPLWTEREQ